MPAVPNVLSIAGSDPSGGAGIQADLKTFAALGVYGCAAITALTAQSTRGVTAVMPVSPEFVDQQLETLLADVRVAAVKIGMLGTGGVVRAVAAALRRHHLPHVVVDPVMAATAGGRLLDDDGIAALRDELLPLATVVTPNASEAGILVRGAAPRTVDEARSAAHALHAAGARSVLVTGGHLAEGDEVVDVLYDGRILGEVRTRRVRGRGTHGTGCTLSSAIAAFLARGVALPEACARAQRFVANAIAASGELAVGAGNGPVHPLHEVWTRGVPAPD